ncbi:glycosyltransferase [Escherichia coli]|uniref:glycosyltransferase n=1 Tax=Escherichia coli TaxID=562 RepID=UPI0012FFB808|nr:glycosyltransferase [Escherichia coli]EIQ0531069.1 glycosyltransferase [Escherichia coli]
MKILFLRFYNKVIVLTKRDESKLSSYGINSECISNPVFFRNYKRKDRNRIALAVGRLEFQKGFDILIDIWSEFVAHNKTWKLFIIGEGSMRSMLEAKISTLNLQDYVVLIGLSTEIDKYYKEADVLLSTSRYEGLPMVMLEAKAWSMPIISFDCPTGPRELISDGYDGYLIKLNDKKRYLKCLELIDNDKNYFSLVDNVEETVKELEALNIKNKWQRLLD